VRLFFFSSRRRHTRSDRDWSSDERSSDLQGLDHGAARLDRGRAILRVEELLVLGRAVQRRGRGLAGGDHLRDLVEVAGADFTLRSEERRVGKESRYAESANQLADARIYLG